MPARRSASDLIALVRDHIQHFQQTPYRDGFPADATNADGSPNTSTSILRWLNVAQTDFLATAYSTLPYTFTLTPGVSEYVLDPGLNEITHVVINGSPLLPVTIEGKDATAPGWQASTVPQGMPTEWYCYGDKIGFTTPPDQAYVVTVLADDLPADLVSATDYPARLPSKYHEALAARAAMYITNMDVENPAAPQRLALLKAIWDKAYIDLQREVEGRRNDSDDQIQAGGYRRYGWRGGDS